MNKFKVAILDDEPDAVAGIELIIQEFCPQLEVVATANLIDKGWELIRDSKPDLVLLDIDMPRGSGFDLLERFPIRKFDVIFITAYAQFEEKAKAYGAFEYLLKPIDIDGFVSVIQAFIEHKATKGNPNFKLPIQK